jgi:hypothetical protein
MSWVCMKIRFGLGNQLFMAALGLRLAHERAARLFFDLTFYAPDANRKYQLDKFSIDATTLRGPGDRGFRGSPIRVLTPRYWRAKTIVALARRNAVREKGWMFDKNVLSVTAPAYLDGYWQSERYFSNVEGLIRQQFQLRDAIAGRRKEILDSIRRAGACGVSLHVRRGDYLGLADSGGAFRLCSPAWYERAMQLIADRVERPQFFIFGDDPAWARANIPANWPCVFIDPDDDGKDFEDLHLMANCRHHIIANSTFSWWGAWLNPSRDKTVIAPDDWFAYPAIDTTDMIPTTWVRL